MCFLLINSFWSISLMKLFLISSIFFNLNFWLRFFQPHFSSNYIFLIKLRFFNISVDFSSLNSFSSSLAHLLQLIERTNGIFWKCVIFRFFNFSTLMTNNTMDTFHRNYFSYWEYFSIILSFFSNLLGEN